MEGMPQHPSTLQHSSSTPPAYVYAADNLNPIPIRVQGLRYCSSAPEP